MFHADNYMVGAPGLEPRMAESKPAVLPITPCPSKLQTEMFLFTTLIAFSNSSSEESSLALIFAIRIAA